MRIAIITGTFDLGGAEHHALKLAKHFKNALNFEVEIWGYSEVDGLLSKMCKKEGIKIRVITEFIRFQRFPVVIGQLSHYIKQVKEFKPDVMISFNNRPNILNGILAKLAGVKCSIWSQQSEIHYPFNQLLEKISLRWITCFISNANHVSQKLYASLPVKRNKDDFHVVFNGIEMNPQIEPDEYWKKILNKEKFGFIATMAANITHTKDHQTLIKAWKKVVDNCKLQNINPLLVLAGREGNTYNDVVKQIHALNLQENIKLLGTVEDITGLNKNSDLGILSSKAEGLPNSIMEQMLLCLPVVGTANDGIKEAVGENMFKYLSPLNDHEDLADKILLFVNDHKLRNVEGTFNKEKIETFFSVKKMGEETFKVIKKYI